MIASRYPLTMRGALAISNALYKTMVQDLGSIEDALVAARRTVRELAQHDNQAYPDNPSFDWAGLQYFGYSTLGTDYRPWVVSPYRGFDAYQRKDAPLFFGRDVERALIRNRIHQMLEDDEPRMLLIAGASGVGKSSLVLAGVVVDLQHPQATPESMAKPITHDAANKFRWRYVYLRPEPSWIDKPAHKIVAAATQPAANDEYTALVVDQLEEIFLDIPEEDAEKRGVIVRKLWQLATSETSRVFVLATIGIEYLSRFNDMRLPDGSLFEQRVALNPAHHVLLSQIGVYRAIIEEPARRLGVHVEPGLWRTLLQDVRAEPGALPLLSYTLNQLWRKREFRPSLGPILTNDAYGKLGGLSGILEKNAEECFANLPSDRHRQLMGWLMVQLVTPTDDLSRATGKRAMFLGVEPEDKETFEELVAILTEANLVVQGDDNFYDEAGDHYLELAHESLIRHWSRLHTWYREAVVWISMRHELLKSANAWRDASEPARDQQLLEGSRLARFQDLWTKHRTLLGVGEREAIDAFMDACILQARRKESLRLAAVSQSLDDQEWQLRLVLARRAMMIAYGTKPAERVIEPAVENALRAAIERIPEDVPHWHHFGAIQALAFSADSKWIASGGDDEIVRVWEVQTGKLVMQLVDHKGPVYALAFHGNGSWLATGGEDGILRLWNLTTGKIEKKCEAHVGGIHALAFHPSGEQLASGGSDRHAYEWSVPNLEYEEDLMEHPFVAVRGISYSRDGRFWVTCSGYMAQQYVWDIAANTPGPEIPSIKEIQHDSKGWGEHADIFAGFSNGFLEVGGVNCVYAVTNDGRHLFVGNSPYSDGSVMKVHRANGELGFNVYVQGNLQALAISKDDKLIAYGGKMGRIWMDELDFNAWISLTQEAPWHNAPEPSRASIDTPLVRFEDSSMIYAVSSDGTTLYGCTHDKSRMVFLNMHDGKKSAELLHIYRMGHPRHDGKFVGVGRFIGDKFPFERQIEIHDPTQRKNTLIKAIPIELDFTDITCCSADGRFVAVDDHSNQEIVVFDTHERQGPFRYHLPNHEQLSNLAIVSVPVDDPKQIEGRDLWRIAWVHSNDNELYLANLLTGEMTKVPEKPDLPADRLDFSPDGKYLVAVGGRDFLVWVWNIETAEVQCVLAGHSQMISGIAMTPDSKLLVTGGNDAKVCVWDIETGTLMRTLETPEPVTGVAISADGRIAASVAVSATSGKGFVWVSPEKLLDTARSLIPRDPPDYLTVAEMRRFGL